jgi:di/tricarboxylate transporter
MSAMAGAGHGQGVPAGAQRGEIEPGLRVTTDQITLFVLLLCVFGLLIWGRWRYDLVAFAALLVALVLGVVPSEEAFSGFGHPATVVIALVLLLSRGLMNSGVIDLAARYLVDRSRSLTRHIGLMGTAAAALSAVMNNVAALAVLMPLDIEAAAKAKRSPALTLMPLSFATILGGMITLIGTPPNIIVAAFRERALGAPFGMFDFAPVGLVCAAVGVVFVAAFGWRLIPAARSQHDSAKELSELDSFIAEVRVSADSSAIGKKVRELYEVADEHEIALLGLVRRGRRLPGLARREEIKKGDVLVVEAAPAALDKMVGVLGLKYVGSEAGSIVKADDVGLMQVVVPYGARIEGRSALSLRLLYRQGVNLLGVSRQGTRFRERVRQIEIRAGDILLLLGPTDRLPEVATWLGCMPLAGRERLVVQHDKAGLAIAIFAAAIALASTGVLDLPVALAGAAVGFVAVNIVPVRQVYESTSQCAAHR